MEKVDLESLESIIYTGYNKVLKHNVKNNDANFFLNGGNSIRAMELVNYLNHKYDFFLTIEAVFKNPSIHSLALYIARHLLDIKDSPKVIPDIENVTQQLGIYILAQQDQGGISYNMPICYEIQAEVDCMRLKRTYQKIQEEFDIFRTIFFIEDERLKEKVLDLPVINFYDFTGEAENLLEAFQKFVIPFSLDMLPLTRMGIWKNEKKSYIFFDFHHIISDGISLEIFLELFSEYYNYGNLNRFSNIPRKNIHIQKNIENQKKYWLHMHGDMPNETEISGDYPRKAKKIYKGNTICYIVPEDLKLDVLKLGETYSCTEFMVYFSAFMILLSKYTMTQDVVIGIPVTGRTSPESENAMGMFVNTLAIRGNVESEKTYIKFLQTVKRILVESYLNQDYPFYQLVSDLGISGRVSENPLFNIFFIYQNYKHNTYTLNNKEMKEVRGLDKVSKFDLTLEIYPDQDRTYISLEYSVDLYKSSTAESILTHYLELLKNIVKNPDEIITNIKYITKTEEDRINNVFSYNGSYKYPISHFADLFEEKAHQIPEATAVVFKTEKISYLELNERGNAVADILRKKLQKENCIVPFISSRSIEMIVGIIGINKANYAFMNLDFTLPIERLKVILNESGSNVVLVGKINEQIAEILDELDVNTIELCEINYPLKNLSIERDYNSLSYIMYTSGTTGRPKGVMIENNGLVAYSHYIGERYHFTPHTAVLQSTTYTFDPFIVETMPGLLYGAKIVVTDENMILDPLKLVQYMNTHAVNVVDFCPTVLSRVADYLGKVKTLSIVMSGGEILPNNLKDKILSEGMHLFNHYGPTEITVDATIQECRLDENVTLGIPLPFKQVSIINGNNIAGINVPGEICISGIGVARGYLNQDNSTSEVFLRDSHGNKYYRTGDIGKWNEAGEIVYLGRRDKQIKILGHRIEISEIEECIRCIDGIEDAVVVCKNENLIAYYVCDKALKELYLQEKLKKKLPFYMIPSFWMKIDFIPYTINGKIDLKKLPQISNNLKKTDKKPMIELEVKILKIFKDLLGKSDVNETDNFFREGGNSLKATLLLNRIKKETNVAIPLSDFFSNPTSAGICSILLKQSDHYDKIDKKEENVYFETNNKIIATPQQKRLFIIQLNNPTFTGYNMTRCLFFEKNIDVEKMTNVLNEIVKKNEILRTNFSLQENEVYQEIKENKLVNVVVKAANTTVDISDELSEFVKPFDLTQDLLIRIEIIHTKQGSYFFLDIHHIISDGISIEMMLEDIIGGYDANEAIKERNQYKDYSIWLNKKNHNTEEFFWKQMLSGIDERTEIYADYPENQKLLHIGHVLNKKLSYELTQDIKKFCIDNKFSEYAYFISAFFILINRYCMNENILISTPFSGRTEQQYEDVLGFFVNTLLICESVSEDTFFEELMQTVQKSVWGMQENQNYPYEKMCSFLEMEKGQYQNSITDILFVMQNMDGLSNLPVYVHEIEVEIAPEIDYKIILEIQEEKKCYKLILTYASDLYAETNMEYFLLHYLNILQNIIPNCNRKIRYIDEQEELESKSVVLRGSNVTLPYSSVKEIFKYILKSYSGCRAIFDSYRSYNYFELDMLSNKLASFLREKGLRKGEKLVIYAEKCIESIIAILACFKMGIVYIPIDIEWPTSRINYIIDSAKIKFILRIGRGKNNQNELKGLIIDYPYTSIKNYNDRSPCVHIALHDPAYIIFTSGTTGKPKGVQVNQEGIINLWQQNQLVKGINTEDRVLQFSSLSFDALISELTMSILSGASLAVVEEKYRRNFSAISNFIVEKEVTIGVFPPHIVGALPINLMRCVITAGEEIDNMEYSKIVSAGCDYWNEYGPTEGTVCTTMWNTKEKRTGYRIPIGTPICNVNVSIIKEGKVLGIGMVGEIYVEGKNIADGYLIGDKVEISFQKGVSRGYFTGDIGRLQPDGNIEFLGRKDKQVKINGFRIELGEIENAIKRGTLVEEAVAFVRNVAGRKEIVLAFVAKEDVDMKETRYILSDRIPLYMMPSVIRKVDYIPLNSNGKIDILKLEKLLDVKEENMSELVAENETEILKLVKEILHKDEISGGDNFFSVGGTSIEAVYLINRIKEKLGKKISYYNLMLCEDIHELSNLVDKTELYKAEEIKAEKSLMSNAEKQIYLASVLDEKCTYNMSHSYRIKKKIDVNRLKCAFEQIIAENDILHTAFFEQEGNFYKKVLQNYFVEFEYRECEAKLSNESIKKFIRPFDLQKGVLIRMVIIREPESYLMVIDTHHIVFDKTSWNSFLLMLKKYYGIDQQ